MKSFITSLIVSVVIGVGAIVFFSSRLPTPTTVVQQVGASSGPDHYNQEFFYNGLSANKYYGLSSVSASSSSSTAAVLALGAGSNGQFTIGTSTPATNQVQASTTAITINSMVFLQPIATTTIVGVTCNATAPTSTTITKIIASTTNTSLNGFVAVTGSIPTTNPNCYNYWILDKSR